MKFSHDYSKLQDRLFTTIRAGQPRYSPGHEILCQTPTRTIKAMVIEARITNLPDLSLEFLRYDTDQRSASKKEVIDWILKLYQSPPDPIGNWTVYLLERLEPEVTEAMLVARWGPREIVHAEDD
jgi:hypothetical protein